MVTSATLVYSVSAIGPVNAATFKLLVENAVLPDDLIPMGATINSDTTIVVGQLVTRTIVFTLDALFNTLFPTGSDQTSMFRNLFTSILGHATGSIITVAAPVIA